MTLTSLGSEPRWKQSKLSNKWLFLGQSFSQTSRYYTNICPPVLLFHRCFLSVSQLLPQSGQVDQTICEKINWKWKFERPKTVPTSKRIWIRYKWIIFPYRKKNYCFVTILYCGWKKTKQEISSGESNPSAKHIYLCYLKLILNRVNLQGILTL